MIWWAVALGAAVGAPGRVLLDTAAAKRLGSNGPWGILIVNLLGSALLGAIGGLADRHGLSTFGFALLGTGMCGSFTTFSTLAWETAALTESRRSGVAMVNLALSLVGGILLCWSTYLLTGPHH